MEVSSQQKIPDGWSRVTVGDVFELAYGKGLVKKARKENGPYPVYGSSGVVGFHDEYIVKGPKIIVGRKGAAGAVHLCPSNCWPIDTTYFVNSKSGVDTKFAYYLLKSLRLKQFETSTAIPGLNRDDAYRLPILLPPLDEQVRIVAKIETLFSEVDKGIESLKAAREQLKVYRQAVLDSAFNRSQSPDAKQVPLSDLIGKISQGWSPKCELNRTPNEGEWAIIKTTALQSMRYISNECKPLPARFEPRPDIEVNAGDFLMTRKGPRSRTGVVCLVRETRQRSMLCDTVYRFRCNEKVVDKDYLELALNSPSIVVEIDRRKSGISDSGISLNQGKVKTISVPIVGNPSQQRKLVESVREKLDYIFRVEIEIEGNLSKSEALRQSILKKAFSGQLIQKDLCGEPAVHNERQVASKGAL